MNPGDDLPAQLAECSRKIEEQAREIAILRANQRDDVLAEKLRGLLELTATAGIVAAPASERESLRAIVRAAASVLDAEAAALFLVDEEHDELRFEVALGGRSDQVENLTLPLGEGLAGYVASTGQPLAVSNVETDARFAAAFAQKVAYIPRNVLCVPMVLDDRTVGVLEMLDKRGEAPFGVRDIEILGHFARLAALTVQQMLLFSDSAAPLPAPDGRAVLRDDDALEEPGPPVRRRRCRPRPRRVAAPGCAGVGGRSPRRRRAPPRHGRADQRRRG